MNLKETHEPNDDDDKKNRSLNDITKELLEQIKNAPNELFMDVPFDESTSTKPDGEEKEDILNHIKSFNTKPKEIKAYLDRFVINQSDAKKALAIAICDHYNYIKDNLNSPLQSTHYTKQNILMIGPTGVGKTYLIKTIAKQIGVPFVKSDATKFTETGYQGGDVEDLIRQLYKKADNNMELAEHGIIYLDEIDKISTAQSHHHKDVSGRGVQTNLLKLMEDTDVPIRPAWDIQAQLKQMMGSKHSNNGEKESINTKNILFIMSGAFNNLDEIIKKRHDGSSIGFNHKKRKPNDQQYLQHLRTQDLIQFGLEPEFAGRLPVRVALNNLSKQDLYDILVESEASILDQYILSFKRFNIEISFSNNALHKIASIAHKENIGARALSSTLEKIFREFKFELPSSTVHFIFVTEELIETPEKKLKKYLNSPAKQMSIDIQNKIDDECEKRRLSKFDSTELLSLCKTSANKGTIIETINDYLSRKSTNVTHH